MLNWARRRAVRLTVLKQRFFRSFHPYTFCCLPLIFHLFFLKQRYWQWNITLPLDIHVGSNLLESAYFHYIIRSPKRWAKLLSIICSFSIFQPFQFSVLNKQNYLCNFLWYTCICNMVMGRRNRGAGWGVGDRPSLQILVDRLTLFKPGGGRLCPPHYYLPFFPGCSNLPTTQRSITE